MTKTLFAACIMLLGAAAPLQALSVPEQGTDPIDQMIGQMILAGFPGQRPQDAGVAAVREQLAQGLIGGVVLYPENIRSPEQLKALTAYLREARSSPQPFIAVDQEGGIVQRLSPVNGHKSYPSAQSVGKNPSFADPEAARALYADLAKELAEAGFNFNLGPVVDLELNPDNPVIAGRKRSFGADARTVTTLARAFILAHREANIATVAKHFPGHGSSVADSHKGSADVTTTWRQVELEPYRVLAKEKLLDAVMLGHVYHPGFSDGAELPASLSGKAVRFLRGRKIGFTGVVVSDDLEMLAVAEDYSLEERLVKSINSGTDIVLVSNVESQDPELGRRVHAIIASAVRDGRISRARIEQAHKRILQLKRRLAEKNLAEGTGGTPAPAGIQ
jgi:beta-N-acetylhexosaminidase